MGFRPGGVAAIAARGELILVDSSAWVEFLRGTGSSVKAVDILYTLAGAETYRELERGWAPRRYEAWLEKAGRRLLLTGSAGLTSGP